MDFLGIACSAPLRIDPHQLQLLPASLHHVLNAKIKLAAHDHSVRLSGQLIKEIERHRVNLVVNVQAKVTSLVVLIRMISEIEHTI